ncbi:MAG: SDR family NAD(P)-dependent oxidoreductase [Planctomycetota bacterium]
MDRNPTLRRKTILITGGTGTIGSEIVRQVLAHDPQVVRIFSRDETKQAELRLTLPRDAPVRFLVGDVRDPQRLRCALDGVDVVYHAAALKHVPSCEYNPFEAVQTNVLGTQNVIQAAREAGVRRLTCISTDKAVNPTNTMGATKLLAENLVRASQDWNPRLNLSVVRFGNVLGSRGSLLPMLARQMEELREVHVTAPEMTRFMMTTAEAVQLVLEASRRSRGGELFVLKMPALRTGDLVRVFVEEYCERRGWPVSSIHWRVIGMRPGEKLHEELLTREECQRLDEYPDSFVVRPDWLPTPTHSRDTTCGVPASCDSSRCRLADDEQIRQLIEASGVFAQLTVPIGDAMEAVRS